MIYMKTKKSIMIIGLVAIAAVAAGSVIGVNLSGEKHNNLQTPKMHYLTTADRDSTVAVKTGDSINLTLADHGDGGYIWTITQRDQKLLRQTEQFTWGSSGMLGDFGKDTWIFSTVTSGTTVLQLQCQRSFGEQDISETFTVTLNIL
jgi:predicted secreted protein